MYDSDKPYLSVIFEILKRSLELLKNWDIYTSSKYRYPCKGKKKV